MNVFPFLWVMWTRDWQECVLLRSFVLFGARGLNDGFYSGVGSSLLKAYAAGELIGSGPQWTSGAELFQPPGSETWWAPNFFGYLSGGGFLGVKVRSGATYSFGWISYLSPPGADTSLMITGWAFETEAGVAIAAGDKGGQPVPDSAGAFSCGVVLLVIGFLRRHRALVPAHR